MAHKIGDRIKEQASTSGTGAFTLAGALAGFEAFSSVLTADADTTWYCAVNDTQWEIGLGTRTAAGVLARTTVLNSSNADALVNFTAAPVVFCTVPASEIPKRVDGPTFGAYSAVTQTVTASGFRKLAFATKEHDATSAYDAATSRFQPSVAGYYMIAAAVGAQSAAFSSNCLLTIYKNGVEYKRGNQPASSTWGVHVSAMVYLNGTTDYVELYAYSDNTVTLAAGAAITYFQGGLMLSQQGIAATVNTPAFRARRDTNQELTVNTATKIQFNVEDFDTDGAFDSTTNYRFQPSVAGYYELAYGVRFNGGAGIGFIRKNGVDYSTGSEGSASGTLSRSAGADLVYLNGATDYVELFAYSTTATAIDGSSASQTTFAGHFVRSA